MSSYKLCMGVMSGTSLDGIDVALCKIKGSGVDTDIELVDFETYKYSDEVLSDIKKSLELDKSNAQLLCSLNFKLGEEYADACNKMILVNSLKSQDISFIANHGQTIYHQSEEKDNFVKSSLQLGDAATIAYKCKTIVVSNFRAGDIAAGGDGAPLVPFVDYLLYRSKEKSIALHNIGGIANTTILPKNCDISEVKAFDTGPGNMMMNQAMEVLYGKAYDDNGDIAATGKLIQEMFDELMEHDYLRLSPPKSTGRELFGVEYTDAIIERFSSQKNEDIVHTLTVFAAESIIKAYKDFVLPKQNLDQIIFTGGGAYNKFLIGYIKVQLPSIEVLIFEDVNENSDAKEAIAFAVLGNETLNRSYNNCPSATGARDGVILGQVNYF
ncbi:anhydro-N-acetylmuramic acid kinase AnmK [Francisella adeliensis]|uniref:Anhydro-N-acetylmuramic acid kinase n=1 Tax=Francisella adeliensis TaxID=2007306 RepID=A0A2Z4XZL5_9GAMM|nr:anhydro-N-acetylmuramic acid kinase AnmK [Francisella adeliensis]AXA34311.1 anhydro-N-acetylmuramic acid kinase [Francisella adeliensis]MBK2084955.1 anhydro-N-acetylmuramic acid kinase [Francisella adeliensis]MBK2096214.1 anhydro-N-acetylmuramic acid kinase [Francisella adeliensis]QIW12557.1 anhydro-N-acetylmuramic acid kinase [Francisella adeliensis]QIW14430.1 anhydro-N-acetylmuramic acid kinase [Francisella adeliensis]